MEDFDISKPVLVIFERNETDCRKKYNVLMVFLKFWWFYGGLNISVSAASSFKI
jgi:hypothetical protein